MPHRQRRTKKNPKNKQIKHPYSRGNTKAKVKGGAGAPGIGEHIHTAARGEHYARTGGYGWNWSQVGWGFEQPGLVESVTARGRGVGTR